MNLEHCQRAIRCLLWKFGMRSSSPGINGRRPSAWLPCVVGASAAATAATTEAERAAQCGSEFGQHFADRITNRGGAAACVKKSRLDYVTRCS